MDKVLSSKDVLLCKEYVEGRTLPNFSDTVKAAFDSQNFKFSLIVHHKWHFSGFSMILIHYKGTIDVHWSENKEIIAFYQVTNPFFLFFVTSAHKKQQKIHDFVNSFSIWTNQIAKRWDQLSWHCHWNRSMINTQSFIWHDVEQWVNLKLNAATMKKWYKNHHIWPSLRKMLSRRQLFLFTLLHTTPAYAENKWRLDKL